MTIRDLARETHGQGYRSRSVAQEIDAPAMTLYFKCQHYEADGSGADLKPNLSGLQDADFVSVGALINFLCATARRWELIVSSLSGYATTRWLCRSNESLYLGASGRRSAHLE